MLNIDPKQLPTILKLIQNPNRLKDFLGLDKVARAMQRAFIKEHPLQNHEATVAFFTDRDQMGKVWVTIATIDNEEKISRVLYRWEYLDLLKRIDLNAFFSSVEAINSGSLSWSQIKVILTTKTTNSEA